MLGNTHVKQSERLSVNWRKSFAVYGLVLIYGFLFTLQFLGDPLAQAPVVDARENLAWAEKIAAHELSSESFYRALLYPLLLSRLPEPQLLAPLVGLLCHLLNALLCGCLAKQLWRRNSAAWFSGLIYGAYPVSLFFAAQILDITFALTFFLFGLWSLITLRQRPHWGFAVLAGAAAGITVLARPNFLPAVLLFPLIGFGLVYVRKRNFAASGAVALAIVLPLASLFGAQGLVNYKLSGEFRILPWQGAYNLYAANRDDANGKYYTQRVSFDTVPAGMNTTRMESEYLYREAVGPGAPMGVDAMGQYWRSQLQDSISKNPFRWLGLMGRKVVYLFNDWEQYNNLTYAYHKERFPLLKWNPLGWGLLLMGAAGGLALGWSRLSKAEAAAVGLCALAYAAGVLLFFVNARFRLPLAPLLCVFCGGLAGLSWDFLRGHRLRLLIATGLLLSLTVLSYGNWLDARNRETFVQDEILLANAALRSGRDAVGLDYAEKALTRDPARQDARRLQASAHFNLWLVADGPAADAHWEALVDTVVKIEQADAMTWFVRGVIEWRSGSREAAAAAWREGLEHYGSQALSCARALQAVGQADDVRIDDPGVDAIRALLER